MSKYTNDLHSLSHTKWNCKYHVVFAPKYRRKAFYDARRIEVGKILRDLCDWKGVTIIEADVCIDHVHMLLEIPPKMSVSAFMVTEDVLCDASFRWTNHYKNTCQRIFA